MRARGAPRVLGGRTQSSVLVEALQPLLVEASDQTVASSVAVEAHCCYVQGACASGPPADWASSVLLLAFAPAEESVGIAEA